MTQTREKSKTFLERGRISPRDVLEAYERTGLTPMRGDWLSRERGEACAIGAILESAGFSAADSQAATMEFVWAGKNVYANESYDAGFIRGFDGKPYPIFFIEPTDDSLDADIERANNSKLRCGFRDGRRAARFVFGEGE